MIAHIIRQRHTAGRGRTHARTGGSIQLPGNHRPSFLEPTTVEGPRGGPRYYSWLVGVEFNAPLDTI